MRLECFCASFALDKLSQKAGAVRHCKWCQADTPRSRLPPPPSAGHCRRLLITGDPSGVRELGDGFSGEAPDLRGRCRPQSQCRRRCTRRAQPRACGAGTPCARQQYRLRELCVCIARMTAASACHASGTCSFIVLELQSLDLGLKLPGPKDQQVRMQRRLRRF